MAVLGTDKNPLILRVKSVPRAEELMRLCESRGWKAIVGVEADEPENISDLERKLHPPSAVRSKPKPSRNEPCSCGSGKKYKKCCLKN